MKRQRTTTSFPDIEYNSDENTTNDHSEGDSNEEIIKVEARI
jgi:hypothetical protein